MSGKKGKSGRPVGSVAFEKSVRLSVPASLVERVQALIDRHKKTTRPQAKIKRAQLPLPMEGGENRPSPKEKKEKEKKKKRNDQ